MTNLDKWMAYTSGSPSPDNFRRWGYHFMISAALQRRVWMPPNHRRCYANMFVVLTGPPGVGKGQTIKPVEDVLRFWKREQSKDFMKNATTESEKTLAGQLEEKEIENAEAAESGGDKKSAEKPLLIPIAPNSTTYAKLVMNMARQYRRVTYKERAADGTEAMRVYGHTSMCFCLEEMASLFRKHENDTINFLHQCYDCNENYEHDTVGRGRDRIRRVCLSMLAGTTPDFMQKTFDDGLTNQGFGSRTFFVVATKERETPFFMPELTDNQRGYEAEIRAHIKELAGLFGQVDLQPDAIEYLESWWKDYQNNPAARASKSRKLDSYYSRKKVHVMKLAMALHFGESTSMVMTAAPFKQAIEALHEEEKTMHLALSLENENPLAGAATKILSYINTAGKQTFTELFTEFFGKVDKKGLEETLDYLTETSQLKKQTLKDEHTDRNEVYYLLPG